MDRIVQYLSGLLFQCSIAYTRQVFLFVANQLASGVDNTSKFYFVFGPDIVISRDCVKRKNALY